MPETAMDNIRKHLKTLKLSRMDKALKPAIAQTKPCEKDKMNRRFASRQLTFLRNQVPISRVIEALSTLPTRHANGKLSFGCPLCQGFNTCVNVGLNLARCFDCEKNFNPIELVMHQLQISFVQSVKWLMQRTADKSAADPFLTGGSTPPIA